MKLWEPEQHDTLELKCAFYVDMTAALHVYISGEAFILFAFLFLVHLNAAARYSALQIDSSKANQCQCIIKNTHIGMHIHASIICRLKCGILTKYRRVNECSVFGCMCFSGSRCCLLQLEHEAAMNACVCTSFRHTFLFLNFNQCMFVQSNCLTFLKLQSCISEQSRRCVVNMGSFLPYCGVFAPDRACISRRFINSRFGQRNTNAWFDIDQGTQCFLQKSTGVCAADSLRLLGIV